MASKKKSLEEISAEIEKVDQKINKTAALLAKLKQEKQILLSKEAEVKAFEILGVLEETQLSYEAAIELLKKQNPVIQPAEPTSRNEQSE